MKDYDDFTYTIDNKGTMTIYIVESGFTFSYCDIEDCGNMTEKECENLCLEIFEENGIKIKGR